MTEELVNFIIDIVGNENLIDNKFAKIIAKYCRSIDMGSREAFYEALHKYYDLIPDYDSITDIKHQVDLPSEKHSSDYRISRILLSNIRGIPEKVNSKDYGISFDDGNGEYKSMALLGMNGSGKSSIYNALEYMYCGEIGEAKLRHNIDFDVEQYKRYLIRDSHHFADLSCRIETINGSYDIHTNEGIFTGDQCKILSPKSHFISENDIYHLGKCHYGYEYQNYTIHDEIAEKLGLSEFIIFSKSLKELAGYKRIKETSKLKNNKSEIEKNIKEIEQSQKLLDDRSRKLIELSAVNKDLSSEDNKRLTDLLSDVKAKRIEITFDITAIDKLLLEYFDVSQKLKLYTNVDLDKDAYNFLYQGLEIINKKSATDCPFCGSSTLKIEEIAERVRKQLITHKEYSEIARSRSLIADKLTHAFSNMIENISRYRNILDLQNETLKDYLPFLSLIDINNKLIGYIEGILEIEFFTSPPHNLSNQVSTSEFDQSKALFEHIRTTLASRNQSLDVIENNILRMNSAENISLIERQTILKKEIDDLNKRIASQKQQLQYLQSETPSLQRHAGIFHEIKKDVAEYSKIVSREIDNKVTSAFEPIRETVENILREFSKEDKKCQIRVYKKATEVDEESGEVLTEKIFIDLCDMQDNLFMSPNKYYNGFRYKIFCLSVCVSIAIAVRKKTHVNLPIVMDDILTCADFDHRLQFERFFENVIEMLVKYSPKNMPLQIIYFTHDELMYDSVCKVMSKHDKSTIQARLLSPENAEEEIDYNELTYRMSDHNLHMIMKFYKDYGKENKLAD